MGLSIGKISERTGLAVSAIRYYEEEGLVAPDRSAGGQRVFERSDIRRLSFVMIAQRLGFSLTEIKEALASLPNGRTPTVKDWNRLSQAFAAKIDARIAGLTELRENLDGCIGCGCLSLKTCALWNPTDVANSLGEGPRYLMGDRARDVIDP